MFHPCTFHLLITRQAEAGEVGKVVGNVPSLYIPFFSYQAGRGRQRQEGAGRGKKRQEEVGRGRKRQEEAGIGRHRQAEAVLCTLGKLVLCTLV